MNLRDRKYAARFSPLLGALFFSLARVIHPFVHGHCCSDNSVPHLPAINRHVITAASCSARYPVSPDLCPVCNGSLVALGAAALHLELLVEQNGMPVVYPSFADFPIAIAETSRSPPTSRRHS